MFHYIQEGVSDWKDDGQVKDFLRALLLRETGDRSGLIYGMGHAIYTLSDPRAVMLKRFAREVAEERGFVEELELFERVEKLAPEVFHRVTGQNKVMCANVDLYSGLVYKMMGIPPSCTPPCLPSPALWAGVPTGWRRSTTPPAASSVPPTRRCVPCGTMYPWKIAKTQTRANTDHLGLCWLFFVCRNDFSGAFLFPWRGETRSAGVHFDWPKWTKSHLGRSPLRTSLGYEAVPASSLGSARHPGCGSWHCYDTRLPWAAGPMAGCVPYPGLPWPSGVPAAGGFAAPSCCAAVRAVACPARWFPCIALGDSGGASPSPTPNNARNSAMFRGFLRPAPGNWEQLLARVRPWG